MEMKNPHSPDKRLAGAIPVVQIGAEYAYP